MATVEEVVKVHSRLCSQARELVPIKGKEYCGVEQDKGDTLFSRKIHEKVGFIDRAEQYSLCRALEKLSRMNSLMEQNLDPEKEGLDNSIVDLINDVIFAYIIYKERK